jgi:hypothetical protein
MGWKRGIRVATKAPGWSFSRTANAGRPPFPQARSGPSSVGKTTRDTGEAYAFGLGFPGGSR